jgi:hypothetical protein
VAGAASRLTDEVDAAVRRLPAAHRPLGRLDG